MVEFGKRNARPPQAARSGGGAAAARGPFGDDAAIAPRPDPSRRPDRPSAERLVSIASPFATPRFVVVSIALVAVCLIGKAPRHAPSTAIGLGTQRLLVREEPERIVLDWNGPVEPPMDDLISAQLDKYRMDPRRIVLALNSPGGNVGHGRAVMASIRAMGRLRRVDTRLEAGAICASMCVPIYMQGARRSADPAARFMFHEARLVGAAARTLGASGRSTDASRKSIEQLATNILYTNDLRGTGVSWQWLGRMRADIIDRDVWMTAQQLKEQESGVVVALGPEGPD